MKLKQLAAAAIIASLPALAFAMPDGDRPEHGMKHGGMFEYERGMGMGMEPEQRHKMRELMGQQMKRRQEITERYLQKLPKADQQAMQKELEASREETKKAMREQLKPEQREQFDTMIKQHEAREKDMAEFHKWKAEQDAKKQ